METKFTKGEWKCLKTGLKETSVFSDIDMEHIFQIKHNEVTGSQAEANANLLSAAPDMFNALKDLYDDREVWSDLFESQQEFICRVLNKATGSDFFKN